MACSSATSSPSGYGTSCASPRRDHRPARTIKVCAHTDARAVPQSALPSNFFFSPSPRSATPSPVGLSAFTSPPPRPLTSPSIDHVCARECARPPIGVGTPAQLLTASGLPRRWVDTAHGRGGDPVVRPGWHRGEPGVRTGTVGGDAVRSGETSGPAASRRLVPQRAALLTPKVSVSVRPSGARGIRRRHGARGSASPRVSPRHGPPPAARGKTPQQKQERTKEQAIHAALKNARLRSGFATLPLCHFVSATKEHDPRGVARVVAHVLFRRSAARHWFLRSASPTRPGVFDRSRRDRCVLIGDAGAFCVDGCALFCCCCAGAWLFC